MTSHERKKKFYILIDFNGTFVLLFEKELDIFILHWAQQIA